MTEKKLQIIKKEKLDENLFIEDKEAANKNKKKQKIKTSKKNKPIDFLDYAKEKGLDINLQYEETKPMEFSKEFNKKTYNTKNTKQEKKIEDKDEKLKTQKKDENLENDIKNDYNELDKK